MEERRLNPHAPPFYPSKPSKNIPPPPPPTTVTKRKSSVRFPVPVGPRNRKTRIPSRKTPPPPPPPHRHPVRRSFNGGGNGRRKYQEITPLDPNENSTSVMIRNIPNNYTRKLLVEFLETHCKTENEKDEILVRSAFDFVYLPVDFKHRLNAGYAFVNFTSSQAAWKFHESVKGKSWELFESKKIADVVRAKIQGKEALVWNFEKMKLCSPSWEYLPVWFEPPRDGCMPTPSETMKMHAIGEVQPAPTAKWVGGKVKHVCT